MLRPACPPALSCAATAVAITMIETKGAARDLCTARASGSLLSAGHGRLARAFCLRIVDIDPGGNGGDAVVGWHKPVESRNGRAARRAGTI